MPLVPLSVEFLLPLAGVAILLACLAFTLSQGLRSARPRWYWHGLTLLLCSGILVAIYTSESSDTPEMPPEFAIAIWLLIVGTIATIASALCLLTRRFLECHARQRESSRQMPPEEKSS